jgi:hypothetical protein
MDLYKAFLKVDKLSPAELRHCIQLMQISIDNYHNHIKNYPPGRLERFGKPYLKTLQDRKQRFEDRLKTLNSAL